MFQKGLIFALVCSSIAVALGEENRLLGNLFRNVVGLPGRKVEAVKNVAKYTFENARGAAVDVGQTFGDNANEKIQFGSRTANRVSNVMGNAGNQVEGVLNERDNSQILRKSVNAFINIGKDVASNTVGGVKDYGQTEARIIRRKIDLGKKTADRASKVIILGSNEAKAAHKPMLLPSRYRTTTSTTEEPKLGVYPSVPEEEEEEKEEPRRAYKVITIGGNEAAHEPMLLPSQYRIIPRSSTTTTTEEPKLRFNPSIP